MQLLKLTQEELQCVAHYTVIKKDKLKEKKSFQKETLSSEALWAVVLTFKPHKLFKKILRSNLWIL